MRSFRQAPRKQGFTVKVRERGTTEVWSYWLEARSSGHACERILHHMGWMKFTQKDNLTLIVMVERADGFYI